MNQQRETRETRETVSPRVQVNLVSQLSLEPIVSNFRICESESAAGDTGDTGDTVSQSPGEPGF